MQVVARGTSSLRSISPLSGLGQGLFTLRRCSHQFMLVLHTVQPEPIFLMVVLEMEWRKCPKFTLSIEP
jgi:hypothetical protein